jgi:hypothetical protein
MDFEGRHLHQQVEKREVGIDKRDLSPLIAIARFTGANSMADKNTAMASLHPVDGGAHNKFSHSSLTFQDFSITINMIFSLNSGSIAA